MLQASIDIIIDNLTKENEALKAKEGGKAHHDQIKLLKKHVQEKDSEILQLRKMNEQPQGNRNGAAT